MFNKARLAFLIFKNLISGPIWINTLAAMAKNKNLNKEEKYEYLQNMVKTINKRGNVKVLVSGVENLPKEDGYLLFPNHQGYYDALALVEAHPRMFGIVIKKEAANYMLVKQVIDLVGGIAIDRSDMKSAYEVIKNVTERVKNGDNFLIFPEGTTSRSSNEMLPMKGGTFKTAINAKAPIVPVALIDSFIPFNTPGIKKVEVKVHFFKPLYYEDYKNLKSNEIAAKVHDIINEYIKSHVTLTLMLSASSEQV